MAKPVMLDRKRWLGHRWRGHGLDGDATEVLLDDLLRLGVQDSRHGGAHQSLAQRADGIGSTSIAEAIAPDGPLVTMWSVRGAPHVHRSTELDLVRDALEPDESGDGGARYVEAVRAVAAALRDVVVTPTSKGDASARVAARVPASLVTWCDRCQSDHVPDGLFRAAGRQAQLVLGSGEPQVTMLHPRPRRRQSTAAEPRQALLQAYLRVNGPTTKRLYRDWMAGGTAVTASLWGELGSVVRVHIDGKRYELPEALVDLVTAAPAARGTVLVPPYDPYLRQVDRTLLVPDSRRRGEVWRALSPPGALLLDGEVAGTWRYRRSDQALTITPFGAVSATRRQQAAASARRLASATGDDAPTVSWS